MLASREFRALINSTAQEFLCSSKCLPESVSLDGRAPSSGGKDMPAFVPLLCLGLLPTVLLTPLSNDRSLDTESPWALCKLPSLARGPDAPAACDHPL